MRLTQLHKKNYTEFNDGYQLVLPLSLEGLIPEDDSIRLLSHILEGLDYRKLYKAYSSTGIEINDLLFKFGCKCTTGSWFIVLRHRASSFLY
ncbi:MAG: transposase ISCpe5 [Herbinix sp.]|nr:transposase ISCpe5 [Herbinix sp.]